MTGEGGGEERETFPSMPSNPAVGGAQGFRQPNKTFLRKESFGVPRIKNRTELLKGMYSKKNLPPQPPSMGTLRKIAADVQRASEFHDSGANTSAFPGSNVPSMKSFEPLSWDGYFDEKRVVRVAETGMDFNVYLAGAPAAGEERPLLFCLHGGGYTGLTWSLVAKKLKSKYTVAAMDLRSHGESSDSDDFSIDAMTKDATAVWTEVFGSAKPKTVVVGHSLGGAIAIGACLSPEIRSLAGAVVIDVVEGTAMASLPYMKQVVAKRPAEFATIQDFVKWAYTSGQTKSFEAARVSASSQVKVAEEDGGAMARCVWRTDLMRTEPYWRGWYEGMSDRFLSVRVPKILVLAGTDRMDKALLTANMQGKFQMKVLPAGHAIQEDEAQKTCEEIEAFCERFRIV